MHYGIKIPCGEPAHHPRAEARRLAEKIAGLRVFPDGQEKLNLSVSEAGGALLVVSQFTLWGDCARGKRPSFSRAAGGEKARPLYEAFVARARELGLAVATGEFGAMMEVHLVNQGPVTLLLDTEKTF